MKIYTKTGDTGQTSTLSGNRVPKYHVRIEAYGTVDELNAYLGLLRDEVQSEKLILDVIEIQNKLFSIGSNLAMDESDSKIEIPMIEEKDILFLEKEIDAMNEVLPEMTHFVLPGGHVVVSTCHICRTICRRAERLVTNLAATEKVDPVIVKYLNRLSDYLFVLSRKAAADLGIEEIKWIP